MKLKPPVGDSKWLLMSESLRFNWFILTADSFRNKPFDCVNEWITESVLQPIRSKSWFIQWLNTVYCSDTQNSAVIFVWNYFRWQNWAKTSNIMSKICHSLLYWTCIQLLLYVLSCLYLQKNGTLCVILIVNNIKLYKYKKDTEAFLPSTI